MTVSESVRHVSDADAAEVELATRMRLAIGRLHRRLSRRAVGGLTPSQLSVLVTVEQHGPLRLGELAIREVITPPTVTRLVASLHERALVKRVTDPEDGRAALIEVAAAGRTLLDEIRRERTAFIAQRIARLDPAARAEVAGAARVLEQLIDIPDPTEAGAGLTAQAAAGQSGQRGDGLRRSRAAQQSQPASAHRGGAEHVGGQQSVRGAVADPDRRCCHAAEPVLDAGEKPDHGGGGAGETGARSAGSGGRWGAAGGGDGVAEPIAAHAMGVVPVRAALIRAPGAGSAPATAPAVP